MRRRWSLLEPDMTPTNEPMETIHSAVTWRYR